MARNASPCLFCGRRNPLGAASCESCGGPLQPPVGQDPGPPPPVAPRAIATRYIVRELLAFPIVWGVLFGGIPAFIGAILFVVGLATLLLPLAVLGPCFTSIFVLIGGGAATYGFFQAWQQVRLLKHGRPAVGTIVSVEINHAVRHDGRSPWSVQYVFDVDGRATGGAADFYDAAASRFVEGDHLHVLYDASDPARNVPWPPP